MRFNFVAELESKEYSDSVNKMTLDGDVNYNDKEGFSKELEDLFPNMKVTSLVITKKG